MLMTAGAASSQQLVVIFLIEILLASMIIPHKNYEHILAAVSTNQVL